MYVIYVFGYIYNGYVRFAIYALETTGIDKAVTLNENNEIKDNKIDHLVKNIEKISILPEDEDEEYEQDDDKNKISLDNSLKIWLGNGSFMNNGLTILSVSTELGTNRTYLSAYINKHYNCSFRTWITQLRINASKAILTNDKNISISDLAFKVGFSSVASYSRAFSRIEDKSPNQWREDNT